MRRRMIKCKDSEGGSIYRLSSPVIFDGSNNIDTGIHLYRDYDDFTFFTDIEFDTSEQVGSGNAMPTIVACMYELNPWPGFAFRYDPSSYQIEIVFGNSTATKMRIAGSNRCKVCVSVKNKRCEGIYFKIGDNELRKMDEYDTSSQNNIDKAVLVLGSYRPPQGTYGRYWRGTIYDFAVYDRALSEEEINGLFLLEG